MVLLPVHTLDEQIKSTHSSLYQRNAGPQDQTKAVGGSKTWHRVGWNQQAKHSTAAREEHFSQQQQQQGQQPMGLQQQRNNLGQHTGQQPQPNHSCTPVLMHTRSCTYLHSHKQQHTHRTTLVKVWMPGHGGAPSAAINIEGLCDDLNARLRNIDRTLLSLLETNNTSQWQLAYAGTAAMQQWLEGSLDKQLTFATACLLDWCGAAPAGHAEHVLQQVLQQV